MDFENRRIIPVNQVRNPEESETYENFIFIAPGDRRAILTHPKELNTKKETL